MTSELRFREWRVARIPQGLSRRPFSYLADIALTKRFR